MRDFALAAALLALLASCSSDARRESEAGAVEETAPPQPQATEPSRRPAAAIATSHGFSRVQLCKAGIAVVMGRDPDAMTAHEEAGLVSLSYQRVGDNTTWRYRCRVDGGRIIWATDTGRWRTHPDDGVLVYEIGRSGELVVTETYSDGSSREKSFSAAEL